MNRRFETVQLHFERIWMMTLRALDDVKETVRKQALSLFRTLNSLSLKFVDPEQTAEKDRVRSLAIVLPFLLKHGITQKAEEAFALALSTLIKMSKVAGAGIRPHISDLSIVLLESLATTESQQLNYLQLHASAGRTNIGQDDLEKARLQMSQSSPIWDTLDLTVRHADATTNDELLPRLASLVRTGTGLPTRCGTARYVRMMAETHKDDVKRHAPRLLKALHEAANDASLTVRRAMASAIAKVARAGDASLMQTTVQLVISLYGQSEEDQAKRSAAAIVARELALYAADALRGHLSEILPVTFLGRYDTDDDVRECWKTVWQEMAGGKEAGMRLYCREICETAASELQAEHWARRKRAGRALQQMAEGLGATVSEQLPLVVPPLVALVQGKVWDGKLEVIRALCSILSVCHGAWPAGLVDPTSIVLLILQETGRGDVQYRTSVLEYFSPTIAKFKSKEDLMRQVLEKLLPVLSPASTLDDSAITDDGPADRKRKSAEDESETKKKLRIAAAECLASACADDTQAVGQPIRPCSSVHVFTRTSECACLHAHAPHALVRICVGGGGNAERRCSLYR
jgi:proteasome component ECM29